MLFMGIFFGIKCCGSTVLVILLLPLQLLLYVATACTASFHTLALAKSFLASVDKLSRTCSPALTEPGQESGSWAVFFHSSVLKHFGLDISGLTSLGPLRSTPTSQVTELQAPVFSNSKQCVPQQAGSKSKLWGSNPAFSKPGANMGRWFIFLFITCFREQSVGFLYFLDKILWKVHPVKSVSCPVIR